MRELCVDSKTRQLGLNFTFTPRKLYYLGLTLCFLICKVGILILPIVSRCCGVWLKPVKDEHIPNT